MEPTVFADHSAPVSHQTSESSHLTDQPAPVSYQLVEPAAIADQPGHLFISTLVPGVDDAVTPKSGMKRRVSVTDISPVPLKPVSDIRKKSSRSMEATILTSSPYKRKLIEDAANRSKKVKCPKLPKESVKKDKKKTKQPKEKQRPASKRSMTKIPKKGQITNDNTPCSWCGLQFNAILSQDIEKTKKKINNDWLQCGTCKVWMHETCAEESGVIGDDDFVCGKCCK